MGSSCCNGCGPDKGMLAPPPGWLEALCADESAAVIEPVELPEIDPLESSRAADVSPFLDDVAVEQLPPPAYLVYDFIPAGGLAVIFGPPGCGKSFLALFLACCVAIGHGFFGRTVRRGPVVYVLGEGVAGIGARLRAWKTEHAIARRLGVFFRRDAIQLLLPDDVKRFIADVQTLPQSPALIILDTLARCMVGGDENSAQDMGLAVAAAGRIAAATGATVLLLHHTRKDGETERGSTALRGGVDVMVSMKNDGGTLRLSCEKQKDAAEFAPFDLRLKPVGESCVVAPASGLEFASCALTPKQRQALVKLQADFLEDGATTSQWDQASHLVNGTFYNARTVLVTRGYVEKVGDGRGARYVLTPKGREEVTPGSNSLQNHSKWSESHHSTPLHHPKRGGGSGSDPILFTEDPTA